MALTYDGSGNVTSFGTRTFSWTMGRQLSGITDTDLVTSYKYDVDGLRVQKTVNGVVTTYYRDGETLLGESTGNNTIIYEYDNGGAPVAFTYNGVKYYYVTNVLGDIVNICDASGNVVVSYTYDAWGNVLDISGTLANTIGQINPYRYRGYYYDSDVGYYYLQSRYYNPAIGRFINADDVKLLTTFASSDNLLATNLFAYALNNPIMNLDHTGEFVRAIVGGVVGAVIGALMYWLEWKLGMRKWNGWALAGHVALNAALGAVGAHFRYWLKFANLARLSSKLRITQPVLKFVLSLGSRGITFAINAIAKKFTRIPGEGWGKFIKRQFGWS